MLVVLLAAIAWADDREVVRDLVQRMRTAADAVVDSTYTQHREERVRGRMRPQEVMLVKYRRPHDVYLRWTGAVDAGREVLYREGWNDGRIRVNAGRLVPTLNLDPTGRLAQRDTRHSIHNVGFPSTVAMIWRDASRALARPESLYEDLGPREVAGEAAHCYRSLMPAGSDYYADRAVVCMHLRTELPASFDLWTRDGEAFVLVERLTFEDPRINTGLTDADFDPGNPDYGF